MNPEQQTVHIGTRASQLARWQTDHISDLLHAQYPTIATEIQVISTRGDEVLDKALPLIGGKGLFTEALEIALRDGRIDCAVHSLKDLPTDDADGLRVGAIPARADVRDVLISRDGHKLMELPPGATVGTSSRRRAAQLLHHRPDLNIMDIRGNVETRITKVKDPTTRYDATLLAKAGVDRLELSDAITEVLPLEVMLNAPGQGALGIQCRADAASDALFAPLNDAIARVAAEAERHFLHALGGGCSVPIAAYAVVQAGRLHLRGRVVSVDGKRLIDVVGDAEPADAYTLAQDLAQQAIAQGAAAILAAMD